MSQERRGNARFVVELAAEIATGETRFTATTKDISAGGCCIAAAYPLDEGATLLCSLYIVVDGIEEAGMSALETRATVQWSADTGEVGAEQRHMSGLRFENLGEQQQEWLLGVIAKCEASS